MISRSCSFISLVVVAQLSLAMPIIASEKDETKTPLRYSIAAPYGRAINALGPKQDVEFGELVIDASTGRYVYTFWYDGVENKASLGRGAVEIRDNDQLSMAQYRSILRSSAGFDGRRYWMAFFPQKLNNTRNALAVNISEDVRKLAVGCATLKTTQEGLSSCWWHHAILHGIADIADTPRLEKKGLGSFLATSCNARKVGQSVWQVDAEIDGTCATNSLAGRWWRYTVTTDESAVGIASVRVVSKHELPSGLWPFPVPSRFEIRRDRSYQSQADVFEKSVLPESYYSDPSVVRKLE